MKKFSTMQLVVICAAMVLAAFVGMVIDKELQFQARLQRSHNEYIRTTSLDEFMNIADCEMRMTEDMVEWIRIEEGRLAEMKGSMTELEYATARAALYQEVMERSQLLSIRLANTLGALAEKIELETESKLASVRIARGAAEKISK